MDMDPDKATQEKGLGGRSVYLIGKASGAKTSEEPIPASFMTLTAVSRVLKSMLEAESCAGKNIYSKYLSERTPSIPNTPYHTVQAAFLYHVHEITLGSSIL